MRKGKSVPICIKDDGNFFKRAKDQQIYYKFVKNV